MNSANLDEAAARTSTPRTSALNMTPPATIDNQYVYAAPSCSCRLISAARAPAARRRRHTDGQTDGQRAVT